MTNIFGSTNSFRPLLFVLAILASLTPFQVGAMSCKSIHLGTATSSVSNEILGSVLTKMEMTADDFKSLMGQKIDRGPEQDPSVEPWRIAFERCRLADRYLRIAGKTEVVFFDEAMSSQFSSATLVTASSKHRQEFGAFLKAYLDFAVPSLARYKLTDAQLDSFIQIFQQIERIMTPQHVLYGFRSGFMTAVVPRENWNRGLQANSMGNPIDKIIERMSEGARPPAPGGWY